MAEAKKKKKKVKPPPPDEAVGAPAWVVSFADMSLLLLSFFILLLAVSSQKSATDDDIIKVLASIKVGFGYTPPEESKTEMDIAVLQVMAMKQRIGEKSQLLWSSPAMESKSHTNKDLWVRVRGSVGRPILFEAGAKEIPLEWESVLDEIAAAIRHHFRLVIIQGHCSPTEARRDVDGGHELAFRRAMALRAALEDRGVAGARIRVVSCADHDTVQEPKSPLQQRAVINLGTYYLPGGKSALENTPNLRR